MQILDQEFMSKDILDSISARQIIIASQEVGASHHFDEDSYSILKFVNKYS